MALDFTRMLRYVDAVARAGSIRAAAEKLHIVSSALTRRILDLEHELGTSLFERTPRGVRLTAAGEAYLHFARHALSEHNAVLSRIEDLKGLRRGVIRLSSISSIAAEELPRLIANFQQTYPDVTFDITIAGSDDVVRSVVEDETDCGIAFNPPPDPAFTILAWTRQQLCAVMHRNHSLASRMVLHLADCAAYRVALGDSTWGGRQMLDHYLVASGTELKVGLQTNSNEVMAGFARDSNGLYFQIRFREKRHPLSTELVAIPLAEFRDSTRQMVLGVRKGRTLPVVSDVFCTFLRTSLFARQGPLV
ncbi:LysR family transcriptional regulator [Komagataeibacter medellinensis]|uniref:LysR family transcriptional regulator n=1 Tax=Komagataeibacter medellinensis TaxID=1177712 RepID=A0ABQ6VS39_9PROT|nr:LysR family transcriptional regulator [Komagataeibacter medellinensis]KAB8122922.1 LysR family transcriptional regulator [Komagataeibacter medellinensis]